MPEVHRSNSKPRNAGRRSSPRPSQRASVRTEAPASSRAKPSPEKREGAASSKGRPSTPKAHAALLGGAGLSTGLTAMPFIPAGATPRPELLVPPKEAGPTNENPVPEPTTRIDSLPWATHSEMGPAPRRDPQLGRSPLDEEMIGPLENAPPIDPWHRRALKGRRLTHWLSENDIRTVDELVNVAKQHPRVFIVHDNDVIPMSGTAFDHFHKGVNLDQLRDPSRASFAQTLAGLGDSLVLSTPGATPDTVLDIPQMLQGLGYGGSKTPNDSDWKSRELAAWTDTFAYQLFLRDRELGDAPKAKHSWSLADQVVRRLRDGIPARDNIPWKSIRNAASRVVNASIHLGHKWNNFALWYEIGRLNQNEAKYVAGVQGVRVRSIVPWLLDLAESAEDLPTNPSSARNIVSIRVGTEEEEEPTPSENAKQLGKWMDALAETETAYTAARLPRYRVLELFDRLSLSVDGKTQLSLSGAELASFIAGLKPKVRYPAELLYLLGGDKGTFELFTAAGQKLPVSFTALDYYSAVAPEEAATDATRLRALRKQYEGEPGGAVAAGKHWLESVVQKVEASKKIPAPKVLTKREYAEEVAWAWASRWDAAGRKGSVEDLARLAGVSPAIFKQWLIQFSRSPTLFDDLLGAD